MGCIWSLGNISQFMRYYKICSLLLVILRNSCCSNWNWRSYVYFKFEREKQVLNEIWGLTEWIPAFENSKPFAFNVIFLKLAIDAYTSAEDQKLMWTMVTCFNTVRQRKYTLYIFYSTIKEIHIEDKHNGFILIHLLIDIFSHHFGGKK